MARKGLFVVLYGPNNVGKSRQRLLLSEKLSEQTFAKNVDYPLYDLAPTGPRLYEIIKQRSDNLPEEEMQRLFAQNRRDFEPTLSSWLESGVSVVAEDYKGTGIAWGLTKGLSLEKMEEINSDLIEPDVAILLDGPRRSDSLEEGHPYEAEDDWYKARENFLKMADRYGWIKVDGDAPVLTVANRIWSVVRPILNSR